MEKDKLYKKISNRLNKCTTDSILQQFAKKDLEVLKLMNPAQITDQQKLHLLVYEQLKPEIWYIFVKSHTGNGRTIMTEREMYLIFNFLYQNNWRVKTGMQNIVDSIECQSMFQRIPTMVHYYADYFPNAFSNLQEIETIDFNEYRQKFASQFNVTLNSEFRQDPENEFSLRYKWFDFMYTLKETGGLHYFGVEIYHFLLLQEMKNSNNIGQIAEEMISKKINFEFFKENKMIQSQQGLGPDFLINTDDIKIIIEVKSQCNFDRKFETPMEKRYLSIKDGIEQANLKIEQFKDQKINTENYPMGNIDIKDVIIPSFAFPAIDFGYAIRDTKLLENVRYHFLEIASLLQILDSCTNPETLLCEISKNGFWTSEGYKQNK